MEDHMRLAPFVLLFPLAAALAAFSTGCDDSEGTGPIVPVASANVTTTATLRFSPATVNLQQNGTVTWTFNAIGHNVTFANVGGHPTNIPTSFNAQIPRTFTEVGTFAYHCSVHGSLMSGVIIVHPQ
jgi:plastocyanin